MRRARSHPHDVFFKAALASDEVLVAFLRRLLPPDIVGELDFSHLRRPTVEFAVPGLSPLRGDIVVEVMLRGTPVVLVLLLEHQRTVDRLMALRVLAYKLGIWSAFVTRQKAEKLRPWPLPPVMAFVFYNGRRRWHRSPRMSDLFAREVTGRDSLRPLLVDFEVHVEDLAARPVSALAADAADLPSLHAAVAALALRAGGDTEAFVDAVAEHRDLIAALSQSETGRLLGEALLAYLAVGDDLAADTGIATLDGLDSDDEPEPEATMRKTLLDRINELAEARGKRELLFKAIRTRFGAVPEPLERRVSEAPPDRLDTLLDEILLARSADDLLVNG